MSCPLIARLQSGCYQLPSEIAQQSDIRTDLVSYRIFKYGVAQKYELNDIIDLWQDDFVVFLIGCSFIFENALINHGLSIRHIDHHSNVPMYLTTLDCTSVGLFKGKIVVSMRPFKKGDIEQVTQITSHYPQMHGKPIHIGSPQTIGIVDMQRPNFGDPVAIYEDEVPVFWGVWRYTAIGA